MISDCFTFFNEFDILELRLRTLEDVVDRFVICEAPFTFRGEAKPLYFSDHAERFARWRERITLLTYPGPISADPWQNEWGQRDFLAAGLTDCAPDDLVLIGDCDEIPDPSLAATRPSTSIVLVHRMVLARGWLNRLTEGGARTWNGTRAFAYRHLPELHTLSNVRNGPVSDLDVIDSGWHITSIGGAEVMERKMRSYAHAEYDSPYYRDLQRLTVQFSGDADARWVPLDDGFPPVFHDPRYARFVLPAPAEHMDPATIHALEHAHGCFAYVPETATSIAVAGDATVPWDRAGSQRFGERYLGCTPIGTDDAPMRGGEPWIVVDGLGRAPRTLLAELHAAGAHVVGFGINARSQSAYQNVLSGHAPFRAGRADGRREHEEAIHAAGFRIGRCDRVPTPNISWVYSPPGTEMLFGVTVGSLAFGSITPELLDEFLSDAFVYVLEPT